MGPKNLKYQKNLINLHKNLSQLKKSKHSKHKRPSYKIDELRES